MPLQTVEPRRLYRQIAEQLRTLIGGGEFLAGTRLPAERDLARQLGVSRPSVREALIALEVEGWVEVRTGSGVYVLDRSQRPAPSSPAEGAARAARGAASAKARPAAKADTPEWGPLELIRARRVVEGEIAALAARLHKRRDIAALDNAIATMRELAARAVMPLEGDRAFHVAIVEACGNAVLTETVQGYWDSRKGPIFMRLGGYFETADSWRRAIAEHESIRDAIAARDADAARDAMHAHMDRSHARFSASWRRAKAAS